MGENPSDPVQLYLTQMSSSPLLSRQEEFEAARRIEHSRKNLRHAMLGSDYVLQAAVGMLEKATHGRMRIEVVCEGSLTSDEQRQRLMALVGTEPANARQPAAAEPCGFRRGDLPAAVARASSPGPPTLADAPRQGHPPGRGIARAAAAPSTGVGAAEGDRPAHGRGPAGVGPFARGRQSGPPGRSPQAIASFDADHARDAGHASPPLGPHCRTAAGP